MCTVYTYNLIKDVGVWKKGAGIFFKVEFIVINFKLPLRPFRERYSWSVRTTTKKILAPFFKTHITFRRRVLFNKKLQIYFILIIYFNFQKTFYNIIVNRYMLWTTVCFNINIKIINNKLNDNFTRNCKFL